jgi:hypothetical protein
VTYTYIKKKVASKLELKVKAPTKYKNHRLIDSTDGYIWRRVIVVKGFFMVWTTLPYPQSLS